MTSVFRRYTFKLYPNKAQEAALHEQRVMCCQLWNALLQMREEQYRRGLQKAKEDRRTPTAYDQAKEITKLRAACPEWQVMGADSQALVAKMLDLAFKAFFSRAKAGAGASSGYPRYRSAKLWETIPFREMGKGWKFENGRCAAGAKAQSGTHSRAYASIPGGGPENAGHPQDRAFHGIHGDASGGPENVGHPQEVTHQERQGYAGGEPENAGHPQENHGRRRGGATSGQPENAAHPQEIDGRPRASSPGGWRLYVKGVPGLIRARGTLPRQPIAWLNANVIFRDGSWWLSACVEMEPARAVGSENLKVHLDLLDEFARVERVDGAMSAPRESANQTTFQGDATPPGADASGMGSGDRPSGDGQTVTHGADASGMGSGDRFTAARPCSRTGADALGMGSGDRRFFAISLPTSGADASGMGSGDRFSLASLRDECGADASGTGFGDRPSAPLPGRSSGADASGMRSGDSKEAMCVSALEAEMRRAMDLTRRADEIKSERDTRRKKRSWRARRETARAKALTTKAARIRQNALHVFTTEITRSSASLTVVAPPVKEVTKSAKGNAKNWGAAVEVNAKMNRNTLNQAPATAIQMLTYKAAEAAIQFALVKDEAPVLAVGQELSKATKAARKARQIAKREAA